MNNNINFGIDLGGTKIEILALDAVGNTLLRKRIHSPQGDYQQTIASIATLIEDTEQQLGQRGNIGIGTPGVVSAQTGRMKNCNSVWLNNQPLGEDLQQRIGRKINMANDANCFALSEATDGAGLDGDVVFGVIIGTGVGAGLVVNRKIIGGANGIAGEWGHNPLPWPSSTEVSGSACYCGNTGCIETYLSGPALLKDHQRHNPDVSEHWPQSAQQLASLAEQGNTQCRASLERYVDRLARGLSHIINIVDPDVIVLGGGLSNIDYLYHAVPKIWTAYVFSDTVTTRLVAPQYGDSSGVRGAAWLAAAQ